MLVRRGTSARSILGFLTQAWDHRGAAALALALGALFAAACDSRQLTSSPDAAHPTNGCANVGCGAPPMCSTGCQAPCGCCSCTPGQRSGDLVCTDRGCYEPAPAVDGGEVCGLPFEAGPCEAAFPVYAFEAGDCVPKVYGGCQGNGNRFTTLEDCITTCAAKVVPGCLPNRTVRDLCIACGPAGGCAKTATVCALLCPANADASVCPPSMTCYDGVCQYAVVCI